MRVVHILHTSLPHVCGYSIRSDQILSVQRTRDIALAVVTSGQQPDNATDETFGNTRYFRTQCSSLSRSPIREMQLIWALARKISYAVDQFDPDIIHAHSPILVGLPARYIAKRRGLPFMYEVRDLWENASVDRGKFAAGSTPYRLARSLETWLLQRADAVVTIGETLRTELQARSTTQVIVVPNGVDPSAFPPMEPHAKWRHEWNPDDRQVIAYIGSFQPYEGLEILIKAMPLIAANRQAAHLLIVGDGPERATLEKLVNAKKLDTQVTFAGRLPHNRVREVYAVADLLVYPRIATLTTQLTTPLKPLEALSMEKAILASDLSAMRELIVNNETGILFEAGNAGDLAEKAVALLSDANLRARLGKAGRQGILQSRRWDMSIEKYLPVYQRLIAKHDRQR